MPDPETPRLWGEVEATGLLPVGLTGADAVTAVLCVLHQRVSESADKEVADALPREVRAQVRKKCPRHEAKGPEVFDRAGFIERVAEHLGIRAEQGEQVTRAVFRSLQRRLPSNEILHVASELPADLAALWLNPAPPIVASGNDPSGAIFEEVRRRAPLPPGKDERDAVSAVMCRLFQRLTRGEAEDVLEELPEGLTAWLKPCAVHHGERGEAFGYEEFLHRVARDLETTPEAVVEVALAVFAAVRQRLSAREAQDVASQLPRGLRDLWLGAAAIEAVRESART